MSGFSTFFFDFSKSGNILLRSLPNENFLFSSASLSLVDNNSLLHKLRVMAAVDPHGNATYDAQHPAKKSIYAKRNSAMLEKSYKTVFQIAQGLRDFKTRDLNCSYEALVQKEALTICEDRVLATFL